MKTNYLLTSKFDVPGMVQITVEGKGSDKRYDQECAWCERTMRGSDTAYTLDGQTYCSINCGRVHKLLGDKPCPHDPKSLYAWTAPEVINAVPLVEVLCIGCGDCGETWVKRLPKKLQPKPVKKGKSCLT